MKTRYKIIAIAVCAYFGVFLGPVATSNVYCDFVSQEMCTSRITGVILPPLNLIMPSLPRDNCIVNNDEIMEPCYNEAGLLEWPFPPRTHELEYDRNCDKICPDVELSKITFPQGTIKIGDILLDVQIADTEPRRVRGLMFQAQLPYDHGMLFVFDESGIYPLWMLNMQFSLDMIWFDENGNVVHIEENIPPCKTHLEINTCQIIEPGADAIYVVEVTSGFVEKFNITKTSKISLVDDTLYDS